MVVVDLGTNHQNVMTPSTETKPVTHGSCDFFFCVCLLSACLIPSPSTSILSPRHSSCKYLSSPLCLVLLFLFFCRLLSFSASVLCLLLPFSFFVIYSFTLRFSSLFYFLLIYLLLSFPRVPSSTSSSFLSSYPYSSLASSNAKYHPNNSSIAPSCSPLHCSLVYLTCRQRPGELMVNLTLSWLRWKLQV